VRAESVSSLDDAAILHASAGFVWSPCPTLQTAAGLRYVRSETTAPWYDVYWRWNEKWGARSSGLWDFERSASRRFRFSVLRYSEDHVFELGLAFRDEFDDVSIVFNFLPAIGGVPMADPFSPRDDVDYQP
jgi:hypothetical protein